jgi:hypothetical protein
MIGDINAPLESTKEIIEDISGPTKRQMWGWKITNS